MQGAERNLDVTGGKGRRKSGRCYRRAMNRHKMCIRDSYTSDLHLGHANVIRHCDRPFADADEMDAALINNWNAKVHRNDTVYIVGDFLFRAKRPAEGYLSSLKGKKHLIIGNHDKYWMKKINY